MIVFEAVVITAMVVTGMYALVVALMWSVALASVIARLVLREGFADVSFRLGGRRSVRWFVIALLFPQFVGFVAFGAAWLAGLAPFTSTAEGFWTTWLAASTVGTLVSCVYAAGEEIGWRGYMLTRLIAAGVPRPVLVSGLIWGLWHVPLILVGLLYAEHPFMPVAAVVFVISATATAFVLARARLESGSLWPCILLHGAYNSVIQAAFWPAPQAAGHRSSGSTWRPGSSSPRCWCSPPCCSVAVRGPSAGHPTSRWPPRRPSNPAPSATAPCSASPRPRAPKARRQSSLIRNSHLNILVCNSSLRTALSTIGAKYPQPVDDSDESVTVWSHLQSGHCTPRARLLQSGTPFPCEADVDYAPILPEFDPDLNPLGYALALELFGKSTPSSSTELSTIAPEGEVDRFGWEFDFEAA